MSEGHINSFPTKIHPLANRYFLSTSQRCNCVWFTQGNIVRNFTGKVMFPNIILPFVTNVPYSKIPSSSVSVLDEVQDLNY